MSRKAEQTLRPRRTPYLYYNAGKWVEDHEPTFGEAIKVGWVLMFLRVCTLKSSPPPDIGRH